MPNLTLYEQLEKSHRKTLREIAGDSDSWKRFLDSAGYTYRQSFKNQVAMYSQKPGMKAVLTEKRWEDMNRAVKGGTTGVRIFDDKSPNHISYVYDYADTVPGSPPPGPRPWTVHKNKSGIALHNLLKRTGEKNLDSYIRSRVQKIVDSEVLPNAAPSVKAALQHCLEQSAMYVACKRLGLPTDDIDIRSFSFVVQYQNRPKVLEKLGTLLNHTLRACLEPVRSVAYSMNMTMPAPEEIAAQAKQPEPSAAPAVEATPQPPDLTKASVRLDGDTITIGNGEATHEIDVAVSDEDHAAMLELAKAKQPVKHRPPQAAPDTRYEQLSLDEAPAQNAAKDYGFEYQLLDRLRTDCDYFLGAGNRSEKQLWAGSVQGQIAKMRELYDLLPEKPEWLTLDDISKYAQRMESGGVLSPAETAATPPDSAADHAVEIPVDGEWKKFQTVKEAEHAAYQEWIKEGRKNAVNYISTGDAIPSGGPKARFQDNIAALRLLQHLDATGQQALPDQQRGLARYVGWGGLSDAFDGKKAEWAGEYKTLKELLPAQEYEAARASTLTSFYTPPEIIRTMYETLERFGLKGGNILEPSMGVGAFFANRPASFDTNGTMLYGVELDPVTGRIAQQLFPKANIQITGYEKASLPDSFFDAVVGNVPFGQYKVNDPAFNRYNFLIHDYFAAKNIDKLRVGGIQAIITTSGTMDKKSEDVRRYLAARCDLIGAVRLPNTAFKAAAGTEVTADILFLQKRDGVLSNPEADWLHVGQTADGIPMNQYFIDHPEMICGKMEMVSGPYGPRPTCQPDTDTSLEEQLRTAMGRLQAVLPELAPLAIGDEENAASSKAIPADPAVRNYSYCVRDGKIYFRRDSLMWEQTPNAMTRQRIEGMVGLLSATRELIQAQVNDLPEEEIARLQRQLSRQYDDYVSKYGRLYSRANNAAFHEDSGYSLLRSLERVDEEGNFAGKADMFTKRTIRPTRVIDHVDTAAEALVVSLAEHGGIDLAYMQQLSGKTQEELVKDLSGLMFRVPGMGTEENPVYQTAEEYLSGNVRQKLEQARQAAALDPVYRANADALAAVQPKELTASEINVHLGTTWIPADDVRQFVLELMQPNAWVAQHIQVHYEPVTARWSVTGGRMDSVNVRATATYGTKRRSFYDLLQSSLNMQPARVDDYVEEPDGKKRAVPNVKETRLAQDKQKQIEAAFRDWIFKDPDRRRRLAAYYNEHYNNLRPREYDGSFLTFPGMNPEITLRPHQRNAVARILFGGNTLVAHAVGAGKTIVMGAAAMEKKRLGLCSKTMIVVPNHLTEQIGSELLTLYPNANILVAAKRDFEKDRRKLFCSRIATGNYDIVILGHSQFTRLPLSDERQQQFLRDEIEQFTEVINAAKKERTGQELSVKQLERAKKSLESRLEKLMDAPKDDAVTFEELGVDSLMVDEAHQFKNLAVQTKMQNVSGITTAESRKATDLLMKCQYLDEITGGKGVVFCTGTPISNSAAELYTMMRYIQADTLREHGLYAFDAYSWQLIENKQRYISQIMTSKTPARSCEDLDEATLTYAEVKALCAGNPLIKEKMDLDNEVARLSTLRSAHNAQIYELQDLVSIGYPAAIRRIGQELDALRQDAALFQSSLRKDDKGNEMFSAVIQGVTYTKRADADAALLEACKAAAAGAGEKKIGRYCGFDICVGYDPKIIGFAGYLQGEQRYRIELNPKQNFSSFRAVLENISAQIPVKIAAREEIEKNIESAKEAAKQPFAYEEEFQTKLARLNELNILLDQEKQELVQNEKENRMQKENVNLHAEENEDWEASTVEPAAKLPAGWKWTMYSDGSGRLEGPDKQSLYSYDRMTYASAGEIEYRKSNNSSWDVFPEGSLDRFREWAEQQLLQELKKEPLQYQEFLEHQSHQDDEIEKNPLDMEDAARQAGLTVQRDQDKPGAAYFDADQNVIHVSDAGSEEDVRLSELKGYADAVIQRTATVEQPVRDLESASLAVMLAARYDVGVSDRLSQQLASAHAEAVKCPTFDLPVTLQRLDKALDYCDHFLAHEQERALEQEAENEPEPEQVTELSPQSQAFMMDL